MKPRPVAKLRGALEQRLTAYAMAASASGIGLLAWSQPAAARIVYTKANQQLQGGVPLPLDLNHDGTVDFSLYFGGGNYGSFAVLITPEQTNQVAGYCQHLSRSCWASALRPDVRVGPNQRFGPYGHMVFGGCSLQAKNRPFPTCFGEGPWDDVQHRYLGLEFSIQGKVHYGWARMNVTFSGRTVTAVLTGYAYETVPNKPLVTGKTRGPDVIPLESGSLGHLARGASTTLE
jgi:hypothetical protein